MEYINMILKNSPLSGEGLGLLVEPMPDYSELDKVTITKCFNNYDSAVTIMLKGSHSLRNLEGKLQAQYNFFTQKIMPIISGYCKYYVFYVELHKCQQWLHFHGIVSFLKISYLPKFKQDIFMAICREKIKRGQSYKHRIDIQKVYEVWRWVDYISKEASLMYNINNAFTPKWKLPKLSNNSTTVIL